MHNALTRTGVAALTITALACGSNVIGPENQLQVTNAADNFQFQASNLSNVTQTLSYSWTNSGTQATINVSGAITGGTATLTVASGSTQVYSADLKATGDFSSATGTVGTWTITLTLNKVSGTLNFRVQKK